MSKDDHKEMWGTEVEVQARLASVLGESSRGYLDHSDRSSWPKWKRFGLASGKSPVWISAGAPAILKTLFSDFH